MIIPGYLDGYQPPFTRSPLVEGDLVWPAFLYTVGGSRSAPAAFDIDPADLSEIIDAMLDAERWPVFSLPMAHDCRLHIVSRNFPDDSGVDYVLEPGAGEDALPLAAMEGHFRGPALAWPELIAAARQPDPGHTAAERLLLLLPACADRDRPEAAAEIVAAALASVGARDDIPAVSAELLSNSAYWTHDCVWSTTNGALVCLGSHAYRRPGGRLSADHLRLITAAFRG